MKLSQKKNKYLRKLGHNLFPVVTVADRGLSESVLNAIEEALDRHELVKVKIRLEREQRETISKAICEKTSAQQIQKIGMVLLIYRPGKKSKIEFS